MTATKGASLGTRSPRPGLDVVPAALPRVALPPMNALEILRETARILRHHPAPFLAALGLLICPVSAALLSGALVPRGPDRALTRRFALLAVASGFLPTTTDPTSTSSAARFVVQMCSHLSGALLSSAFCFPLLLTLLLLAKAAVAYSVACAYAGRPALPPDFRALARSIWRRVAATYLWVCAAILSCLALFVAVLVIACSSLSVLGYPPEIVVYPALLAVLAFSVAYAHTIIVCNLATVISVLEERWGFDALLRSVYLVRGQTQAGLIIFLGSTIGMAFVEGLFEHRVKTLSYGDGSSRLWEAPLLVVMYSFVLLIDSMMSAVFYFTCRSSSLEELSAVLPYDGNGNNHNGLKTVPLGLVDV